ncbi:MAG: translocation/assembly module TamB domain-containing protein [Verrucomicrobia bacterium]|nr:translocation/assembly module TamB domain-containing protein [Verrucomicrobiota bacterium]
MRRRILILFSALLALLVLSIAALPWWLGPVAKWQGGKHGLTFGRYERIGYGRFALHDAAYRIGNVRVTMSRIEADTPVRHWWRMGPVVAGKWAVEVTDNKTPAPVVDPKTARGWVPLRGTLQKVAGYLERWSPSVTAEAGVVRWPGSELASEAVVWTGPGRELKIRALAYKALKADATAVFAGDSIRVTLKGSEGQADLENRGADVRGTVALWDQPATFTGKYGERGWLPVEAVLEGAGWKFPGEKLKLDAAYATVEGRGKIEWRDQKLAADFAAKADPVKGKSVPPLDVTLRGHGDTESFAVESLNATLPVIVARLSEAVTVERSGKFRQSGAKFTVEADLGKQPWFTGKGLVAGEARLVSGVAQRPVVEFQLAARDAAIGEWAAALVSARGQFDWPRVQVAEGTLTGTAGEKLTWSGGWDFVAKEILQGAAEGQIRRATVARWVPANLSFETVTLQAAVSGPLGQVKHGGRAQADGVTLKGMSPLGVKATWAGHGATIDSLVAEATAGTTTVAVEGATDPDGVRLTKLELTQGGARRLALTAPAAVRWRPALQVESLHLAGPDGSVDAAVVWGETGRVDLAAKNFSSVWLGDLGVVSGAAWKISTLTAKGAWARGPMDLTVNGLGEIALGEGKKARIALAAQLDRDGLRVGELSVKEGERSVVKLAGKIPLRIAPGAATLAELDGNGALALEVTTEANAEFWQELKTLTGVELKEPEAVAHVTGTWAQPQGTVTMKAARVTADAAKFKWPMPKLEALDVELAGDVKEVRLTRFAVTVEGQAVRASGRRPVAEGKWRELAAQPMAWLQGGVEGSLQVPDADVAALARFLPVFVAPKGRIKIDVFYREGAFGGSLELHDAATRPLGPLGVLQEINAELVLSGRKVELKSVKAESGGQTMTLTGSVELPAAAAANDATPASFKYDLRLKGDNLPFVRQTGVLLRGDLDLKLTTPDRGTPRIAGTVKLRESLFLSDVRALLPGGARTKSRVPPYFAVEAEPYDRWRLDIAIQGEKFLKLRTALFNGVSSARFQLSGTLGEPLLRGEATIDEGNVKLPFATFAVQEGRVSLTPEQGVEPQVWFVGTVRRLNYDLRMEASGPASEPVLVFSSSPPLESGQVLLMVMAGESPHDEISYSDRQRVARLGTFLGQSLLASLGGESEAGERLSLSTGETVSRQGRETYGFEYKLSDKWSLVGEYDEFDDFNAGVKWRVFSKGGQKQEPKK